MSVIAWKVTSADDSRLVGRSSRPDVGAGGGSAAVWPSATSATVDSRMPSMSSSALTSASAYPNTSVGRDLRRRRDREDVRERRAGVPVGVPVGALAVAPRVAPERARHGQHDGCGGDRRLVPGRVDERGAEVAPAQPAQAVVDRGVVVDAGGEVGEIGADEVQLEVVLRAGAAGRAVVVHTAVGRGPGAVERTVGQQTEPAEQRPVGDGARSASAPVAAMASSAGRPVSGSSRVSSTGGSDS